MRHLTLLALTCATLAVAASNARANIETVEARIVYVSFSDDPPQAPPSHGLPAWEGEFATELPVFLDFVSNQGFNLQIQTLRRPDDATKAWVADHPSTYYRGNYEQGQRPDFGDLNEELVQKIWTAYGGAAGDVWNGVDVVFVYNYNNVFHSLRGIATLGLHAEFNQAAYGFSASGMTMVLLPPDLAATATTNRVESITGHEYGHLLFPQDQYPTLQLALGGHTPGTGNNTGAGTSCGNPPVNLHWVNYGHYDGLTGPGANPGPPEDGFISYHPMYLAARGWLLKEQVFPVTGVMTTVRVRPLRQTGGKVVEVAIPGSTQKFLLTNHQATGYDAIYGGTGLLIWHILPGQAWDLESAAGKTVNPSGGGGTPDPNTWWDPLEAQVCARGSVADFFLNGQPGQQVAFTPFTNPNTNIYGCAYSQGQVTPSGVTFTNMRYESGTLDVLVDVCYAPVPATITSPPAGIAMSPGETVPMRWTLTGTTVDILLSDSGGANFTIIANDIPNTGQFDFVVPALTAGSGYRLRVEANNIPATGINSPPIEVWGMSGLTAQITQLKCENGVSRMKVHAQWNTSQTGNLAGNLFIIRKEGTPLVGGAFGTLTGNTHAVDVWVDCATGTWTIQVFTSLDRIYTGPCGAQTWHSSAITTPQSLNAPTCLSCGGSCRPPCEFD